MAASPGIEPLFVPAWPDAGQALGIGRTKLFELLGSGELESVQIGVRRVVPVEALHEFARRLREQG